MEGAGLRFKRERRELAWLAWHTAALTRANKMPKIDALIDRRSERRKVKQSWQEQLAIARQWQDVLAKQKTK